MRFEYDKVWADAVAMLRAERSAVVALAGVFLVLPTLLIGHFVPFQAPETDVIQAFSDYVSRGWLWMLIASLVQLLGGLAILRLFLKRDGSTVGGAIAAAATLLPTYFVANLLNSLMITIGLFLFIVPGLYLLGRVALTAPVIAAEDQRNPIDAIQRSFALTEGNGWRVLGLLLLVYIVGGVANAVATVVLGSLFILAVGQQLGLFISLIMTSIVSAATGLVILAVTAALYERLRGAGQDRVSLNKGI